MKAFGRLGLGCVVSWLLTASVGLAIPSETGKPPPDVQSTSIPDSARSSSPGAGSASRAALTEEGECLSVADRLFAAGAWDVAITEYKRFVFFNDPGTDRDHAGERIGRAYWNLGMMSEAQVAFLRAAESASNDSARAARRLGAACIAARAGETSKAELELARLRQFTPFPAVRREATLQLALIEMRQHRWNEALTSLESIPGLLEHPDGPALDSLLRAACTVGRVSPERARRLSTFLPGLGQVASGATSPGLHSFALNGLLAWQLAESVLDHRPGNTLLLASFLRRYYRGSQHHAARLAEERNAQRMRPLIDAMEQRLQTLRAGDEP
jgi:tetratricopeptide (TPR) repeat protein